MPGSTEKMRDDTYASKKWVVPYKNIVAIHDGEGYVEIVEQTNCFGGACWAEYHYKRTSPLIVSVRNVGNTMRYLTRVGREELILTPSIAAAGIEAVEVDSDTISITYAGLGGGGVGATISRALAEDVIDYDFTEIGGSRRSKGTIVLPKRKRVLIGVDDTDTKEEGATWSLVHNIAHDLDDKNARYISHSIVQLYPVPFKTQNCVSTVVEFACIDEAKLIRDFERLLRKYTLSPETGMVALARFDAEPLREYGRLVKQKQISREMAERTALEAGAEILIDGRGVIGALAALPYFASPMESVVL
ncbi:tRNA(Ile2) 2-agmatinylcytidine synthetase [Methanocella conradii HZ254]|uniref:tRNA(Ile2) 2-agmatinylcytidine synthetase n=2 Tax=Methanocella TaxID=570266 RepID=H8I722_METCZ|nr:methanogenesis marker protein 11 [Methanocella conradii]AFC99852.1 tRNA(Ile2) 2-agmatinylcytidine synthetase [Methanocella conradii HZ254]